MVADFVHLRVHSAYSLAEGAVRIDELIDLCNRNQMPAVAVTDTSNLFGALEFSIAASKAGIQPIVGCQLSIIFEDNDGLYGYQQDKEKLYSVSELVVLVQTQTGYRNLLHLVSKSYSTEDALRRGKLSYDDLLGNTEGLIALTGGANGEIARLIENKQSELAHRSLETLIELFPERLYIEIQRHNLDNESKSEKSLIELAYSLNLPLVATNEVFYTEKNMYEAHDALLCISQSAYISQPERRRVTSEHYFKSAEEMKEVFSDLPEAIKNTIVIAQRCSFMPIASEPKLPPFKTNSENDENTLLREQAHIGLKERLLYHVHDKQMTDEEKELVEGPYYKRLQYELDVIEGMGYSGYFLIVADFIKWSKSNGIAVGPGRGSGAGSVVAWALTITDLDPLKWGLFFERFLNPERVSMPDFDIDFCQARRDEVIRYVQERYGHDRVAQIITFGKLQARAVVRDVGRVLEMPYGMVDRIAKMIPANPANPVSLEQAINLEPQLKDLRISDENVGHLLDLALKLEGLYRNTSTHAAGVVIGDRPLEQSIPLYRDPRSDTLATQFSMKYVELAGLVKFDFLGLKTLDVIQKTLSLLLNKNIKIDLASIPLDDLRTFEMLGQGDTTGVFQCESTGVRDVLRKLKPDRFEDIIAVVALYRPGPMDNIPSYISRKHGIEKVDYLHESLEECLSETYGIPIYQEQVMQMAQNLAGFTLGSADLLRRAMGKKIKSEMDAQRDAFVSGATMRKVDEGTAIRIFDTIAKFAGYGFNKAHAAAYALIAYQTAYLKSNYPVEFFAASMTLDINNTDKLSLYKQELENQSILLLSPDINYSEVEFSVEHIDKPTIKGKKYIGSIRYALAAIKGVGPSAMETLVKERIEHGEFKSIFDLANRLNSQALNKRLLENLVGAGALNSLEDNRASLFVGIDKILNLAQAKTAERESGQFNLLGQNDAETTKINLSFDGVEQWSQVEVLEKEREAIGFYLTAHPLDEYTVLLERMGVLQYINLKETVMANGGAMSALLSGVVLNVQKRTSQRGSRYAFVQLSDASGTFETTVFSELLAENVNLLEVGGRPILLKVAARMDEDQLRLTVQSISDLEHATVSAPVLLKIWINDYEPLGDLKSLVEKHTESSKESQGNARISLIIPSETREVEVRLDGAYLYNRQMYDSIKKIPGVIQVQEA